MWHRTAFFPSILVFEYHSTADLSLLYPHLIGQGKSVCSRDQVLDLDWLNTPDLINQVRLPFVLLKACSHSLLNVNWQSQSLLAANDVTLPHCLNSSLWPLSDSVYKNTAFVLLSHTLIILLLMLALTAYSNLEASEAMTMSAKKLQHKPTLVSWQNVGMYV